MNLFKEKQNIVSFGVSTEKLLHGITHVRIHNSRKPSCGNTSDTDYHNHPLVVVINVFNPCKIAVETHSDKSCLVEVGVTDV